MEQRTIGQHLHSLLGLSSQQPRLDDVTKRICNFGRAIPVTAAHRANFRPSVDQQSERREEGLKGEGETGRVERSYYYHNFRLNALRNSPLVNSASMFAHVRKAMNDGLLGPPRVRNDCIVFGWKSSHYF